MPNCEATAILIRHGDITGASVTNPDLNANGIARAVELVHMLGDAGIEKIYATKTRRSQQTARFLADHLGIDPDDEKDDDEVVAEICGLVAPSVALIVGHTDTLPTFIISLGGPQIPEIGDDEFDHLYVLTRGQLTHLRYTH